MRCVQEEGFRYHLPVVGCGGYPVEGVVGKNNRIVTPNTFLQEVPEAGVASSGPEEPEETRFEACLCSLQAEGGDSIRSRTRLLSRVPTPFRKQKVQRTCVEK